MRKEYGQSAMQTMEDGCSGDVTAADEKEGRVWGKLGSMTIERLSQIFSPKTCMMAHYLQ